MPPAPLPTSQVVVVSLSMSSQSRQNAPGYSHGGQAGPPGPPPNFPEPNVSAPGYPGSHYHHATQAATGTAHPTTYGSRVPASPWPQPGMPIGYAPPQGFQQPPVSQLGQSPRVPYSPRLTNEPELSYPLGFARQQASGPMAQPWSPFQGPAGVANASGGSHSRQSVNEPYHVGFIRPPNPGSNTAARPPPQGHGHAGPQNTSRGSYSTGHSRKRKGLVIGTNYSTHPDHRFKLRYCTEDAYGMAHFICTNLGFARHDVRLLTDEAEDPQNIPTKDNILAAMRALVHDAQPGDSFFFYFSGHGIQIKDLNGDEFDGQDECICAIDYHGNDPNPNPNTPGLIVDDVIHDIFVRPLPRGCRLTAMFDSCHSGTALDLPYQYDSQGTVKRIIHQDVMWLLSQKASYADVVSLSASRDNQRARETRLGGALRCAFTECVGTGHNLTYRELLHRVREYMRRRGFPQRPQLSTSYEIDTNNLFVT